MHDELAKFNPNQTNNALHLDGKTNTVDPHSSSLAADAGISSNLNNQNPIEEPRRDVLVSEAPQRSAVGISLRLRAEEEIVNDAKRKKMMLELCEQNANCDDPNSSHYSITRLRGLRVLNLSTCNRISDVPLKYNFQFLELKSLNLSRCQQISSEGIEACLPLCPSLEVIDLSQCHNITDRAINAITTQVKRLTHLHIERCIHLTDHSLDHIALNCTRLRTLDVRGCRSMCSQPNLRLEHIRSLKQVASSKPGPYVPLTDGFEMKRPHPPPMPSSF